MLHFQVFYGVEEGFYMPFRFLGLSDDDQTGYGSENFQTYANFLDCHLFFTRPEEVV